MGKLTAKAVAFDMYRTVVDVGAVAEACTEVVPDPAAFTTQWRTKQLDYTFLRTLMGKYRDFWVVSAQALEYTARCFHVDLTPEQRRRLMEAWLRPRPYPEVPAALALLKERYPLAILSRTEVPGCSEQGWPTAG